MQNGTSDPKLGKTDLKLKIRNCSWLVCKLDQRDISDRCNFSTTPLEEKSKSKSVVAKVIDELYSKDVKIASRIRKN